MPGVLIIRPDAPLFYANAQVVQDGIRALVAQPGGRVHTVLLDLDANDEIDITSVEALAKLDLALHREGVRLGLTHVHGPAHDIAERAGLLDQVTPDRIHFTFPSAVQWAKAPTPATLNAPRQH